MIPCYYEPEVFLTLESLFRCQKGNFVVEIILVINSYQISSSEIQEFNRLTFEKASSFAEKNNSPSFYLTPIFINNLSGHQTGAGVPRKIGMDLAINHFQNNPKGGIIVSLDADCTVEENYLTEIYCAFKKEKLLSATIEFHHPVEHLSINDPLRKATSLYEEYLRYYKDALTFTGYPYAYYTIGSAFAVTSETYQKVGGMGKQQAGEDFYFLQKVFPLGKTMFINTTCVYPAARISDRVPFGTGPVVAQMLDQGIEKSTYTVKAFIELKNLFDQLESFYQASFETTEEILKQLPIHLQEFLQEDNFLAKLNEINLHTATYLNFRKRFFSYFTAFKILKYLNAIHPSVYPLSDVIKEYCLLKQQ